jgi:uridine phosphorylase
MDDAGINHEFLDAVLAGSQVDAYYHLGVTSADELVQGLRGMRAVILGGSGPRMDDFARLWSAEHDDAPIVAFPKEERFVIRYTAGVLFASHGMGMPSASIALQELMRLAYFVTDGDPDSLDRIFWARVGTSGGVGLPAGTVVVSTEGVMADLEPYRLLDGLGGYHWFDGHFPLDVVDAILAANSACGFPMASGRTVAANDFFVEQFRLDGAIRLATVDDKMSWLNRLHAAGVRNIEMEGAMLAAYLNMWGFPRFAMVCTTLLDRLDGDQVTSTPEQLHEYSERAGRAMFAYLRTIL